MLLTFLRVDEVHDVLGRRGGVELREEVGVAEELDERLQGAQVVVVVGGGKREQVLDRVVLLAAELDRLLARDDADGSLESAALGARVRHGHVLRDHEVGAELLGTLNDVVDIGGRDVPVVDHRLRGLANGILPVGGLDVQLNQTLVQKVAEHPRSPLLSLCVGGQPVDCATPGSQRRVTWGGLRLRLRLALALGSRLPCGFPPRARARLEFALTLAPHFALGPGPSAARPRVRLRIRPAHS